MPSWSNTSSASAARRSSRVADKTCAERIGECIVPIGLIRWREMRIGRAGIGHDEDMCRADRIRLQAEPGFARFRRERPLHRTPHRDAVKASKARLKPFKLACERG